MKIPNATDYPRKKNDYNWLRYVMLNANLMIDLDIYESSKIISALV